MIPKRIIEKAIEGGWKPQNIGFPKGNTDLTGFSVEGNKVIIGARSFVHYGKYEQQRDGEFWVHATQIALDPLFWQAFGKSCGWKPEPIADFPKWKYMAKAFYDLILTGGDTDAYWNELLGVTK